MELYLQLADYAPSSDNGRTRILCLVTSFRITYSVTRLDSLPSSHRETYSLPSSGAIPGKTYGSQPISPSCDLSRRKDLLHRLRNAGVWPSPRKPYAARRPLDRQMADLQNLRRCEFPAREKACINRDHSELAQGCIAPPERSKCQSTPAVWAGDYYELSRAKASPITAWAPASPLGRGGFLFPQRKTL